MNRIKFYRKRARLTQKRLAELAKIDRTAISSYENGKGNPTQETLIKIARVLNCNVGDLIDGQEK